MKDGQTGGRADGQRLARIVALAVLVLLITSYWWLPIVLRPMKFFAVRRVEVKGNKYLAADDVVRDMGLRNEASVFDDLGSIERRLESVSGIVHASISRDLPGTLRVTITEVEPVALAQGPSGMIALARDAKPLPYDVVKAPVDAPIVPNAEPSLVEALAVVQSADLELFADVASARMSGREVDLDVASGRVRLDTPVDPEVVRSVSSVRRDLGSRGTAWRELDGRFKGWVVVRRADGQAGRRAVTTAPARRAPQRARRRPAHRTARQPVSPSARLS